MGTIQHDVVAAVGADLNGSIKEAFEHVKAYARKVGEDDPFADYSTLLIGPFSGVVNLYETYLMVPDGSKEWWQASDNGNLIRERFIEAMTKAGCEVGHMSFGELGSSLVVK